MNDIRAIPVIPAREETQARLDRRAAAAAQFKPKDPHTIADRWADAVRRWPERTFLCWADRTWTYAQADTVINSYANVLLERGVKPRQSVALMMENRPEFYWVWLALMKLGAPAAFINVHLNDKPLAHALRETRATHWVYGNECAGAAALEGVDHLVRLWVENPHWSGSADPETLKGLERVPELSRLASSAPIHDVPAAQRAGMVGEDVALYIFTSGTTGLPKAALTSHMRWMMAGAVMESVLQTNESDVFYCFLPLYHGAASMALTSTALMCGSSIVLRRKFSASQFWPDVRRYGVTSCQYVGEIIRYLLAQPERPDDRQHTLVRLSGTGLNRDTWLQFQGRFGVRDIFESWGSTEGNVNSLNLDNVPGSCGRVPFWDKTNLRLIRYDIEHDEHLRDDQGRYIICKPGEVGEAVGFIVEHPDIGGGRFEGYTSQSETEKKILRGVLSEADKWFRTGDLLREDENGYLFFVDRLGDTFRWKSENVSTLEVASVLEEFPGVLFLIIYGVEVPGFEGRAGMAAIQMQDGADFNAQAFFEFAKARLPRYALPQFLRLATSLDMTGTYKLRKVDLQRQAYAQTLVADPLWVIHEAQGSYVPLSAQTLAEAGYPLHPQDR
jgi:fatty-acyl-CoA synthase